MESSYHHSGSQPQRRPQIYTPVQITKFLNHIGLPQRWHNQSPSLALLQVLHTYMISTIPYENLAIHYSPTHTISLDPQILFDKVVTRNAGRGGYCMENALLYYHVLCGLGFDVYTAGARTRERDSGGIPGGNFPGWVHIVNIVTLPPTSDEPIPQRYHVDIAFGGDGALMPIPLAWPGKVHQNLGNQQIRLVREYISTQTYRPTADLYTTEDSDNDRHKLWIYQYRNSTDADWNSYYAFSEIEFMAMDWEVVNYWTSTSERSLQTHRPLCILFLRQAEKRYDEDGRSSIYGKRMLVADTVKENLGGKTRILAVCKSEEERVRALREYFGITLSGEEISGIRGLRSELKTNIDL